MMTTSRIYCVIIAIIIRHVSGLESTPCQNGGKLIEGTCVCPPKYTGSNCDVKIDSRTETEKDLESCFSLSESDGLPISGSGVEVDSTEDCDEIDHMWIQGKCQRFSTYQGSMTWNTTNAVPGLSNETSPDYVSINNKSYCLLKMIFQNLPVGMVTIEKISGQPSQIDILFVIKTAINVTLLEVSTSLQSARNRSGDVIAAYQTQDYNECERDAHDCHLAAKCINIEGSYKCECPESYVTESMEGKRAGSFCRHICRDEFGKDFCLNGGVCAVTMERTWICECPLGYVGSQCEQHWAIYFYATIGVSAAFGLLLVIFCMVVLMFWARKSIRGTKSKFQAELEQRIQNGDKHVKKKRRDDIGISNPYASAEEGITIATKVKDEGRVNSSDEEDRL